MRFRDRESYADEGAVQIKGDVKVNQGELQHSVDLIGQAFKLMLSLGMPLPQLTVPKAVETTATRVTNKSHAG